MPGGEFVLPDYVERDHDRRLGELLTAAADGDRVIMVVVRGGSCAGKTRTAFEGVRACLGDWQLAFPKDTGSLLTLLAVGAVGPRTVLWLNEAQEFLAGPAGEEAAAAMRRLLESSGPIVVVVTLWPAEHHALTRSGSRHPQAYAVLKSAVLVDVPDSFTASDLWVLEGLGHPSLEMAARTGAGGAVTQALAAGPQWRSRGPGARGARRERGWILFAIADIRQAHGDLAGAQALVREAGEAGLRPLAMMRKNAGDLDTAEALLRQAGRPAALYALAMLRSEAGDQAEGDQLTRQAADSGDGTALWDLSLQNEDAGDHREAERLARLAGNPGVPGPLQDLAP